MKGDLALDLETAEVLRKADQEREWARQHMKLEHMSVEQVMCMYVCRYVCM